ncbi:MAG TPA: YggT family protein [Rhizomicrobium sp.]|nr:YggT family protein [Rhizomicrobium sp.]
MLNPLIGSLLYIFDTVVDLYLFVIILAVVVSWLVAFGVLNTYNQLARSLVNLLDALTEPALRPIRRIVPPIAGLDLSPLILFIALRVIQGLVDAYVGMLMYRV